jgi:hypothetical protein
LYPFHSQSFGDDTSFVSGIARKFRLKFRFDKEIPNVGTGYVTFFPHIADAPRIA